MKKINLYKVIKGELVLVDYGVKSQTDSYIEQGYIVVTEFGTFKYKKRRCDYD